MGDGAPKIRQVADGDAQFRILNAEERLAAHALIDARITDRARRAAFGPAARAAGHTTVALDATGAVIESPPAPAGS